ncbi:LysM peptidoglycan-binding domain-containing protein [Herbaspirillum sp. AP02]|uniref:FimV/HubP family polar landmark protein n=1 Tax=unclassified Herbaspirillum TaxID=2624150 RepID=UPI0015DABD4D|nr:MULTISPECIES: FimV/HubP family polar landmark protein [unclassified Herbaspirillum]MBG7621542.1 LysM peptidoglycan-binding domain-containing protein [Herbaspirillum sp. AP02]NZD69629.1 LysM peptidoglycan-binding domain-containing protein [Herbaspirillum sp. AP21]
MPLNTNKKLPLSQMKTLSAAVALALALPLGAQAAGLGKLTVLSSLGQPLRAEIEVTSVSADEAGKLSARLAPAEAFRRANMDYNPVLGSLSFVVEQRQGRHFIRISSSQPVSDPFVDLLMELSAGDSRLLREYTFLLDPPDSKAPRNAQVAPLTPGNAGATTGSPASGETAAASAAATPATPAAQASDSAPTAAQAASTPAAAPAPTPAPAQAAATAVAPAASAPIPVSGEEPATTIVQRPAPSALAEELIRRQQAAPADTPASASPDALAASRAATQSATGTVAQPAAANPAAPAAATPGKSADYRVKQGDTLGAIAARNQPANVSLDQMLIALYRANPGAFQGNNINRLRAGRILSIPDQPTAAAVDRDEARGMVVAQAQDFNAYRNKLAGQVANAPAAKPGTSRQSGGGKISTRVEERSGTQSARDRLELSRANKGSGKTGSAGAAAEDKAASERALAEANDRVKDLEKNVDNLQKLLELKNKTIAELSAQPQKDGEAGKPAAAPAATPAADAAAPKAEDKPADAPATPAPTPAPAVAASTTPPAASAKPADKNGGSFIDKVKENPAFLIGAGVLVALLAAGGGVLAMRRRKKKSEEGAVEPASEPEPAPPAPAVAAAAAVVAAEAEAEPEAPAPAPVVEPVAEEAAPAAAVVPEEPVDPISEADTYIAYGRDEQAEDILKLALQTQPGRQALHAKLLEIYAKRGDVANFNKVALDLHQLSGGLNETWVKAAALGLEVDPANPLYGGVPPEAEPTLAAEEEQGMEFDLSDFKGAELPSEPTPPAGAAMDLGKDIDFDLDLENGAKPDANEPILPASSGATSASMLLDSLDETPATSLADLDLSLPEESAAAPSATNLLEEDEESAFEAEMTTKLDLAAAYEEIGDKEGARELLEEVMRGGSDAQIARAKQMMAALG